MKKFGLSGEKKKKKAILLASTMEFHSVRLFFFFFNALQILLTQCHTYKTVVLKFWILPNDFQYYAFSIDTQGFYTVVIKTQCIFEIFTKLITFSLTYLVR